MSLVTILLQIVLTIPLTIILDLCQKKEKRIINQILIPSVYIIFIAAILPIVKENIFLIVVFEIFIRNFYITNITNQQLDTNINYITESILSIAFSLFIYNYFISQVNNVIPNPEDIKAFIWFLIIIYISYLYSQYNKNNIKTEKNKNLKNKKEKIIMQYARLKSKYSTLIKSKNQLINNLIYAIMIFEDNKTPKLYRNINAYIGAITKKKTKYGIMQISSYERLSDEDSIKIVVDNFEKNLKNSKLKENEKIEKLLLAYKNEEKEQILLILKEIVIFNKI